MHSTSKLRKLQACATWKLNVLWTLVACTAGARFSQTKIRRRNHDEKIVLPGYIASAERRNGAGAGGEPAEFAVNNANYSADYARTAKAGQRFRENSGSKSQHGCSEPEHD